MRISKNIVPMIDVLFTFLLVFVMITMLVKIAKTENDPAYQQQNAVYQIILNWEGQADVDLWCKDPQDRLASFNQREGGDGSLFSLNRDNQGSNTTELGEDGEPVSKVNEEIVSLRGTFVGEYVVNVHAFNLRDSKTPLKVTIKLIKSKPFRIVVVKERELQNTGDEQTAFRFNVDKNGEIIETNELPTSLIHSNKTEEGEQEPQQNN